MNESSPGMPMSPHRWTCGIDLDRQHVGTVVQRVIKTDNSKVRRIP